MRVVAYATAAAPTYFDPIDIPFMPLDARSLSETLVDGGIFANNPAMCAYAEAIRILQERRCSKEEDCSQDSRILLVSLGTGYLTKDLKAADAKNWGALRWFKPLLTMIFDGASDTVDYQLKQLPNVSPYYRFQPRLCEEGTEGMDNTEKIHLRGLMETAACFITDNKDDLNKLCCQLACGMIEKLEEKLKKKCGACACCNASQCLADSSDFNL